MKTSRMIGDRIFLGLAVASLIAAVVPLVGIIIDVASKGIGSMLSLDFFTQLPPLANAPGGGLGNAIQGTVLVVALSCLIGLPIGLFSGIYISEYGRTNRYGQTIRFLGDVLAGIPSIVTGVLVYTLIVLTTRSFSIFAGAIALGTMMIPIVSNTTAEALRAVPNSIREASLALGTRKWRTSILVVANAKKSIATGSLLAIARIAGETAPLILTMGISVLWFSGFNQPVASLPYFIYYFATSPFQNWQSLAWGAALFLMIIVLGINIGVRMVTRGKRVYA
jgi:phosphate transport system permease protein